MKIIKRVLSLVSSTYFNYSMEYALSGAKDAGFENIDLAYVNNKTGHLITEKNIQKNLSLCNKYSIKLFAIAAHDCLLRKNGFEDFKNLINIADFLGVRYITTGSGKINSKDDEKIFLNDINKLGHYADDKKITICIETAGDWIENGEVLAKMMHKVHSKNVKINYDAANVVFYSDSNPVEDIKYTLPYLGYIHLKDKRGGYKVWDFPALGEGSIDFIKIMDILKDYNVPFSVEIEFDGKEHTLTEINNAVKKSYKFLEAIGFFTV
ncbi:MAG: sugar phosphate isomerase/epimerase family protein [Candidatus Humimicrobiaceae bacterium]